mgnify:CR=1 FL=1
MSVYGDKVHVPQKGRVFEQNHQTFSENENNRRLKANMVQKHRNHHHGKNAQHSGHPRKHFEHHYVQQQQEDAPAFFNEPPHTETSPSAAGFLHLPDDLPKVPRIKSGPNAGDPATPVSFAKLRNSSF